MQPLSNDLRRRILSRPPIIAEGPGRKLAARLRRSTRRLHHQVVPDSKAETGSTVSRPHRRRASPPPSMATCVPSSGAPEARRGDARRHARGAPTGDGRLRQPDDHLPGPAKARPAAEEEDAARLRARHARGPTGASRVRRGGRADRASTACLRGRDRRPMTADDSRLRPGPSGGAGRCVGAGVVGVGDGDRGDGAGRGPRSPAASPARSTRRRSLAMRMQVLVPALRRGCGGLRQPEFAPARPFEAIGRAGAVALPLPPCSPDFNLI